MSEENAQTVEQKESQEPEIEEGEIMEGNTMEKPQSPEVGSLDDPLEDDKQQQREDPEHQEHPEDPEHPEHPEHPEDPTTCAATCCPLKQFSEVVEEAETQANLPEVTEQTEESQSSGDDVGTSTATVKVVLVPEGHVMTVAFAIGLSIGELKQHLASELRVPPEVLHIFLDGQVVEDQQALMDLGVRPHGSTRMEMSSADPHIYPLRPVRPPEHDNMPDVITVRVQRGDESPTSSLNDFQEVVVEIQRPPQRKPFLGGYKHRLTGTVYHHAGTQTHPQRRPDRGVEVFSRDTQTVEMRVQSQQCPADVSTQMTGIGCYVSCTNDKLLTPGGYTTATEYHERRLKAVIRLQAAARCWLAKQAVGRLRQDRDRRLAWLEAQERRRKEEKDEQLRDRRRRWKDPQKREDFNLLYHALDKWRKEEEQLINATLRGAERKAALCSLLDQELEYIQNIGHKQIIFNKANADRSIGILLDKSAAPYHWRTAKGKHIEMDTVNTIRARELRDLYNDISTPPIKQSDRLQVLMTLKHTVKEHNCQLTRDLVDLVDREVDLMTRCVKASSLEGLRQRINTLLLQYIKTPAFNPQVAKLLKVSQDVSQLKNNMLLCRSCHRYLPTSSFSPALSSLERRCRDCAHLDNIARNRDDFSCYKHILKRLRADEQLICKDAKIPFLMQVEDIRYLIEVIWSKQSALLACSDLYNLVLVRWDQLKDWSPWNCILLAKEETPAHSQLRDVYKAYEAEFVRRIEQRHMLARQHFSQIPVIAAHMDPEPHVALGNHLVSKPIATATGKHARHTP
ncbi:IQ and ubiquitin-like domain-containing protein [Periophthalmus magnuspinnatus]|uniref:IQ and ubiquitin-like domain-containing protein n=1 Tax=Periophthalmus magnuspinnatus TaxID=409849 RepID=UPI002436EDF3|nr:IQ and ubiquitin-like domain-containing protein [Periophthalmus magnuspinnatus]